MLLRPLEYKRRKSVSKFKSKDAIPTEKTEHALNERLNNGFTHVTKVVREATWPLTDGLSATPLCLHKHPPVLFQSLFKPPPHAQFGCDTNRTK